MNEKEKLKLLLKSGVGSKFENGTYEFILLHNAISKHPKKDEKIGVGVDYFYIQASKWNKLQFNYMIKRLDGSSVDFSYISCFSKEKGNNWNGIFRQIVKDQIDDFRTKAFEKIGKNDIFICSQTNLKFKKIYAHVDHVFPLTFDSILNEFITNNNLILDEIPLSPDLGTSELEIILDENLIKKFYEHHKNRAVLRMVYKTANLQAKKTSIYDSKKPEIIKEELIKIYPQYHL